MARLFVLKVPLNNMYNNSTYLWVLVLVQQFYRLDSLPVIQPTLSKD